MPRDSVYITVNNERVDDILSYSFDSDLFQAADAFEFTTMLSGKKILAGSKITCWVNDRKALVGIVDKGSSRCGKSDGGLVSVDGRDLMGILCDHCSTTIGDIVDPENIEGSVNLTWLVKTLLGGVPFVQGLNDVVFQKGALGLSVSFEHISTTPGSTVFEILRQAAMSRGLHFWLDEEGKFVFGKPVSTGAPLFSLVRRLSGQGNNIITGTDTSDITEGFSQVTIYSQSQGTGVDFNSNNTKTTVSLNVPLEFPFFKPKVLQINGDSKSPELEAKRLLNQVKAKARKLEYTVPGHTQGGVNYKTNVIAHIEDEKLDVVGDFLIYGRLFTVDKEAGPVTVLKLGLPGVAIYAS
jgi:prophage tail gpP-like protein